MPTIPGIFASLAASARTADRPAVVGSYTVTFGQLYANARLRRDELAKEGVGPHDVVAIVCYNEVALFEYLIATGLLHAALLPLSPALPQRDLGALLARSGAVVCYFSPKMRADRLAAIHQLAPTKVRLIEDPVGADLAISHDAMPASEAVCWLSTTAGSTGTPRLFATSHDRLLDNLMLNALEWRWPEHRVYLALAPLSHGIGFCHALGQLVTGGTAVLVEKYSAVSALGFTSGNDSVWTAVVPTMLRDLLGSADERGIALGHLKLVVCAGAALSAPLRNRFLEMSPGSRLIEYYGSTELGWVTWIDHRPGDPRSGLIGWPGLGTVVRIRDRDGRIAARGQIGRIERRGRAYTVPFGPELRGVIPMGAPSAWETSGDLGYIDADGAAVFVGREDDMVVVGGLNVYPIEVEAALIEHPAVREAVVVGVENERLGTELKAVIELRGGASDAVAAEIAAFAATRLAPHQRPATIEVVDALPRTTGGKVSRARLAPAEGPPGA